MTDLDRELNRCRELMKQHDKAGRKFDSISIRAKIEEAERAKCSSDANAIQSALSSLQRCR